MAPDTQSIDCNATFLTPGLALSHPFDNSIDDPGYAGSETLSVAIKRVDLDDEGDVDDEEDDDDFNEEDDVDEDDEEEDDEEYEDDEEDEEEDEDEDDDLDDEEDHDDEDEDNIKLI
jgi:hypothetical protein